MKARTAARPASVEADPRRTEIDGLKLGQRIRTLRQGRELTLRELAERAGVTESFLSQVEREVANPSIASILRIARALDLSIVDLFTDGSPQGRIVRRDERRRVAYPGLRAVDEPYIHESDEEVVLVLEGTIEAGVADERYVLHEGDALTYDSRLPHWRINIGDTPARLLFCLTPPSF